MVTCLIIENNIDTIEIIKSVGKDFPEISFNQVEEDMDVALNNILKNQPEIVIINIESKKLNLFKFLYEISQHIIKSPNFIALSTSKENAFESYEYDFSDFILKPLQELTVRKSLLKYQKKHFNNQIETICLKSYKDYQYLNLNDILYLKADNNTTDFFMTGGQVIGTYKTLKVFENLLPPNFIRIHKSYIVNRNCISRIHYGKSICVLDNKIKIPFTKTFIANIDLINTALYKSTSITLN